MSADSSVCAAKSGASSAILFFFKAIFRESFSSDCLGLYTPGSKDNLRLTRAKGVAKHDLDQVRAKGRVKGKARHGLSPTEPPGTWSLVASTPDATLSHRSPSFFLVSGSHLTKNVVPSESLHAGLDPNPRQLVPAAIGGPRRMFHPVAVHAGSCEAWFIRNRRSRPVAGWRCCLWPTQNSRPVGTGTTFICSCPDAGDRTEPCGEAEGAESHGCRAPARP